LAQERVTGARGAHACTRSRTEGVIERVFSVCEQHKALIHAVRAETQVRNDDGGGDARDQNTEGESRFSLSLTHIDSRIYAETACGEFAVHPLQTFSKCVASQPLVCAPSRANPDPHRRP
jgi:hypothetical protein